MSRRKKLTNNSGIPQHALENIARILLPDILAYYESEEVKCVSSNFSKKTNNPNPSPIKKIWFGLFWFGAGGRT